MKLFLGYAAAQTVLDFALAWCSCLVVDPQGLLHLFCCTAYPFGALYALPMPKRVARDSALLPWRVPSSRRLAHLHAWYIVRYAI